jgi:hypothetical protein
MMTLQERVTDIVRRIVWLQQHPVLGKAAAHEGSHATETRGLTRRLAEQLVAGRPDIRREFEGRLKAQQRPCPHCQQMIDKRLGQCSACGKFVPPHVEQPPDAWSRAGNAMTGPAVKAEIDALVRHPAPGGIPIGAVVVHTPTGQSGRLVQVHDGRAVLRDPSGAQSEVPFDEIDAFPLTGPVDMPGGEHGGYGGAPAHQPRPDLGGPRPFPPKLDLASAEGQLALSKTIQRGYVPHFARHGVSTGLGSFRKGGSRKLARGQRVRNRQGKLGVVLGSNLFTAAVEYHHGDMTSRALEKLADLEAL